MPVAIIHFLMCVSFGITVFAIMFRADAFNDSSNEASNLSIVIGLLLFSSFVGWLIVASKQDEIEDGIYTISEVSNEDKTIFQQVIDSKGKKHNITEQFQRIYNKDTKVKVYYYDVYKYGIHWDNSEETKIVIE